VFEKYSELSLRSLDIAQAVAREFLTDVVRDEHLLLGVIGAGNGTAAASIKTFNIGYKHIHEQLKELTAAGSNTGATISFDISGKRTLEKAWLVARDHGHKKLYTGHILIGILILGGGVVDVLLQNLLINKMELREKIVESFNDAAAIESEDATPKHSCVPAKFYDYLSAEGLVAMTFAEQEARKSGLSFLGAEHILIGLLMQETGAAAQTLKANNVTLETLRRDTQSVADLSTGWTPRQLPLTRRAVKILQAALAMAEGAGQDRIDTEQILLAISRGDGGLATKILEDLGVKIIAP
jgi:ATP-dependent Clp protease ATP-binding subunit ClpA